MTIAILAHDSRKELALQFCTAYSGILSRNTVIATGTTGRMLAQATGLPDCAWWERHSSHRPYRGQRFLRHGQGDFTGVCTKLPPWFSPLFFLPMPAVDVPRRFFYCMPLCLF